MTLLNEAGETEQNREQNVLENDGATSGKVPSYCQCTWLKKTPTKALHPVHWKSVEHLLK